jgi:hypothetical protein
VERRTTTSYERVLALMCFAQLIAMYGIGSAKNLKMDVPDWVTVVPGLLLLATIFGGGALALRWRFQARRRDRWEMEGRCVRCGYDRGGIRTEVKCPECGAGWREFSARNDQ